MKYTPPHVSPRRRILEILAVIATASGKFIFMDWLQWKLPFILVAIAGWITYVFIRRRHVKEILQHWGFRTDNFKQALRLVLPFGVVSVVVFFSLGYYLGTINLSWHIIPILILYPVWGVIQQFLVFGMVAGNLKDRERNKLTDAVIISLTAIFFGLLHYPFYWLMLGTFVLALFYGYVYFRARNVYVLGIFHGWLGGLFFYTVVGRDPFQEVFGKLL